MERISFEKIKEAQSLMTRREVARVLHVCERTVFAMTKPRGPLPCVRVGKRSVRYSPEVIQNWIQSQITPIGSVA